MPAQARAAAHLITILSVAGLLLASLGLGLPSTPTTGTRPRPSSRTPASETLEALVPAAPTSRRAAVGQSIRCRPPAAR